MNEKNKYATCRIRSCINLIHCKGVCSYHYEQIRYNRIKKTNPQKLRDKAKKHSRTVSHRFYKAKADAEARGLSWKISRVFFENHIKNSNCYYCLLPLNVCGSGLDRIDNTKGYIESNVVSCCGNCNLARGKRYTTQEFKIMIEALNEFRAKVQKGQ